MTKKMIVLASLVVVTCLLALSAEPVASRWASLQLPEGSSGGPDTSRCLDTVPLDECLFGTEYFHVEQQSFVNISIARPHHHAVTCDDITPATAATLTVPLGVSVPLREVIWRSRRDFLSTFLNGRDFARGITARSLHGSTPDDDSSIIVRCPAASGAGSAADAAAPQQCDIEITSKRLAGHGSHTTRVSAGNASYVALAHNAYCVAITNRDPIFTAPAFGKRIYADADCSRRSDASSVVVWHLAPLSAEHYALPFQNGATHVTNGLVEITEAPPATCHHASFLASLYCHSCAPSAMVSSGLWSGPCPLRMIETPHVDRALNYEVDPICRPASCVSFTVHDDAQCRGPASLLTLPCGGEHDRDSTGSVMSPVVLECDASMEQFKLSGGVCASGGDSAQCTTTLRVPRPGAAAAAAGGGADDDGCVLVKAGLLAGTSRYLRVHERGADCETFGLSVSRKARSSVAVDTDRLASGTCLPLNVGGEPLVAATCVDWNARMDGATTTAGIGGAATIGFGSTPRIHLELIGFKTEDAFERAIAEVTGEAAVQFRFTWAGSKQKDAVLFLPTLADYKAHRSAEHLRLPRHRVAVEFASWRAAAAVHSLSHSQLHTLNVTTFAVDRLPTMFPATSARVTHSAADHARVPTTLLPRYVLQRGARSARKAYVDIDMDAPPTRAPGRPATNVARSTTSSRVVMLRGIVDANSGTDLLNGWIAVMSVMVVTGVVVLLVRVLRRRRAHGAVALAPARRGQ